MPYTNPVIPGFHPDPSICRVGEDYYCATSSFSWFPGVPLFHSRDLVHWKPIGHVAARPEQLPLREPEANAIWNGIWAPTLRHHDGRFYLVTTDNKHQGNVLFHTDDIHGDWQGPIRLEHGGWDNSLHIEADGTAYYHWTGGGIQQTTIDLQTGRFLDKPRRIYDGSGAGGLEAPHLYHIGDWWYLVVAEGGTHWGHQMTIVRSRSPWGPWEENPHGPMLTHRHTEMINMLKGTGHGDLLQAHDGSWWLTCLGMRDVGWVCFGNHHLGRETMLAPFTWQDDDWPLVNGGEDLQLQMDVPTLPLQPWPDYDVDASTDDTFSDATELAPHWNWLRAPPTDLQADAHGLHLVGGGRIDTYNSVLLARRQQHLRCDAWATIDWQPAMGEECGLTTFMDEHHHTLLAIIADDQGGRRAILRRRIGSLETVVAEQALPATGAIELRVHAEPQWFTFGLRCGTVDVPVLGHAETRHHSTEIAYGFTGVFVGLYAHAGSDAALQQSPRLTRFRYQPHADQSYQPDMHDRMQLATPPAVTTTPCPDQP